MLDLLLGTRYIMLYYYFCFCVHKTKQKARQSCSKNDTRCAIIHDSYHLNNILPILSPTWSGEFKDTHSINIWHKANYYKRRCKRNISMYKKEQINYST